MPFENNSFDFILCNHVLEHVYDDELAIIELRRVLKKNGMAILQVPLNLNLKKTIDGRDINDIKKTNLDAISHSFTTPEIKKELIKKINSSY